MDKLKQHAKAPPKTEKVETPEWAELDIPCVHVRAFNGERRDAYHASLWVGDEDGHVDMSNASAKLCALGLCDEAGKYLYTVEDAEWLGQLEAAPIHRIADRVRRMSGLHPGAVEEARKN